MAERYGTIPKRFTKDWWEYFWYYYKIPTLAIVGVIIAISLTVYSKLTAPKYDLTVSFSAKGVLTDECSQKVQSALSRLCPDTNGNGERLVFLNEIPYDPASDDEYNRAMRTKLELSFAADEVYIYILDEEILKLYCEAYKNDNPFTPVDKWCKKNLPQEDVYVSGGKAYAVSLKNNNRLKKAGLYCDNKYLAVRYQPRNDQKEQISDFNAAVKLANSIIKP